MFLSSSNVLRALDYVSLSIPVLDIASYDIRIIDEDGDDYTFFEALLQDGSEITIHFGPEGYTAELYDGVGDYLGMISGAKNEANNTDGQFDPSAYTVSADAPFDANTAIPDLGMLVPYPSEAFFIFGNDDHYVQLASLDNKAVFEIWLLEQWMDMDTTIDFYVNKMILLSEQVINGRMINATDIQWYEVDIERTDYGNTASVQCIINEATYTIDGEQMRTMCRVGRWTKISDQTSYYYCIILTVTEDYFDFYQDNFYYRFRDSLLDT